MRSQGKHRPKNYLTLLGLLLIIVSFERGTGGKMARPEMAEAGEGFKAPEPKG